MCMIDKEKCVAELFEEYKDETAFQEHRAMPYMLDFRPKREECVEKYLVVRVMSETYSRKNIASKKRRKRRLTAG